MTEPYVFGDPGSEATRASGHSSGVHLPPLPRVDYTVRIRTPAGEVEVAALGLASLYDLLQAGAIDDRSPVSQGDGSSWRPLGQIPELARLLSASSEAAGAIPPLAGSSLAPATRLGSTIPGMGTGPVPGSSAVAPDLGVPGARTPEGGAQLASQARASKFANRRVARFLSSLSIGLVLGLLLLGGGLALSHWGWVFPLWMQLGAFLLMTATAFAFVQLRMATAGPPGYPSGGRSEAWEGARASPSPPHDCPVSPNALPSPSTRPSSSGTHPNHPERELLEQGRLLAPVVREPSERGVAPAVREPWPSQEGEPTVEPRGDLEVRLRRYVPAALESSLTHPLGAVSRATSTLDRYRKLCTLLEDVEGLDVAKVALSQREVRARQSQRTLPHRRCRACRGTGVAPDGATCGCVEQLVFTWLPGLPSGAIVEGVTRQSTREFARLYHPAMPPLASPPIPRWLRAGRERLWWVGLASIALLQFLALRNWWRVGERFVDGGGAPAHAGLVGWATAGVVVSVLAMLAWNGNALRSCYAKARPTPQTQAHWLLPGVQQVWVSLLSWPVAHALAVLVGCGALAAWYATQGDSSALVRVRAALLEEVGREPLAAALYDRLDEPRFGERAWQIRFAEAAAHLEAGRPAAAFPVLKTLREQLAGKVADVRRREVDDKLVACADQLVQAAATRPADVEWGMAREALRLVNEKLSQHPEARRLTRTSRWLLGGVVGTRILPRIRKFEQGEKVTYAEPKPKHAFVVTQLVMAHTGKVERVLPREKLSASTASGKELTPLGFETTEGLDTVWKGDVERLGPEAVRVDVVWEVPVDEQRLAITAFGHGIAVDLGSTP